MCRLTGVTAVNWPEILTVAALVLNAVALFYAVRQIKLSNQSIELAKETVDQQRRIQQIQLLPTANLLFRVQQNLHEWADDIEQTTGELESALDSKDATVLKRISETGLTTPKGLVLKMFYDHAPKWLCRLWTAGANCYFDFKSPCTGLWNETRDEPVWGLAPMLIERGKENSYYLKELLKYVRDAVPEAYANAPAGISDDMFLSNQ
jgi:hypothetical protein